MRDRRLRIRNFRSYVASARAFLVNEPIEEMINLCYLVPIGDWKTWGDEYGNILKIGENKSLRIYKDFCKVKSCPSDLFLFALPDSIAKFSSWAMLAGEVLWMVGFDSRLRMMIFDGKIWLGNFPPLLSGIDALKVISQRYIDNEPGKVAIPESHQKFIDFNHLANYSRWPNKNNGEINCLLSMQ